jgi:hypothetical protein
LNSIDDELNGLDEATPLITSEEGVKDLEDQKRVLNNKKEKLIDTISNEYKEKNGITVKASVQNDIVKEQTESKQQAKKSDIERRREEELNKRKAIERKPLDKGLERIEILEKKYSEAKTEDEKESAATKLLNEVSRFRKNASSGQASNTEINRLNELEKTIKDNHGLEIVSRLKGKEYDNRDNVDIANFSNGKTEGEVSIYSNEVRPQVNKNGVMVQRGKYDVLQNTTKEEADNSIKPKESKISEINAKYDALLSAVEKQEPQQTDNSLFGKAVERVKDVSKSRIN